MSPPPVSPLHMTFDFDLSDTPSTVLSPTPSTPSAVLSPTPSTPSTHLSPTPSTLADHYPHLSPAPPVLNLVPEPAAATPAAIHIPRPRTSTRPAIQLEVPRPRTSTAPAVHIPRPRTSTGPGGIQNGHVHDRGNARAASPLHSYPTLPPLPRIAGTTGAYMSSHLNESVKRGAAMHGRSKTQDDGERERVVSTSSTVALKARRSSEHLDEMLPWSPTEPSAASRPTTAARANNPGTPQMDSSLFPVQTSASLFPSSSSSHDISISSLPNVPVMSRQFIDSRDKPYSQPPPRPIMTQHHQAMPSLHQPQSPALALATPTYTSSRSFISPQPSLQSLSHRTNLSASTARPSTRASTQTAHTAASLSTVGTPYQATADSFPLPQHVMTRPKTPGAAARIGGISVPTHHTSSSRTANGARPVEASQAKKKRRLTLNPLAFLQRRHTSQLPEELVQQRQEQDKALQRQRDLLVSGVNKPPPDFDPRIRGRVVHDFSAPRGKRNTFDELDMASTMSPPTAHNTRSAPVVPTLSSHQPPQPYLAHRGSDGEQHDRPTIHTPAFKEHLDETPVSSRRISSIQAESLENKDFLQRASKHNSALTNFSQESATLPPFARRSQILDPSQAACYNDESSKASTCSDQERGSSLGSIHEISPVTGRSSQPVQQVQEPDLQQSQSPVSPPSPGRFGENVRAESGISPPPLSSDIPQAAAFRLAPATLNEYGFGANEMISRPYSVVMAPPAIYSVSESSNGNSPVQGPLQDQSDQQPQVVLRGVSIRQSNSNGNDGLGISSLPPPIMPESHRGSSSSPEAQSVDRTATVPTPERTPEPEAVDSMQSQPNSGRPKLVEKRASAVGHSRKGSNVPRHASTASRFSFQFAGNESVAQEQALEEKHRKMRSGEIAQSVPRGHSPDEDDDDEFDEDAMYDMDEMEMQDNIEEAVVEPPAKAAQSANYLQQARQALQQQDSDDEFTYAGDAIPDNMSEGDLPYPDHPAFRTYSAVFNNYSRPDSYASQGGHGGYWRDSTIDQYMQDDESPQPEQGPASGQGFDFKVEPTTPGGSAASTERPATVLSPAHPDVGQRPTLPARDSGNSERNRAASGMSFGQASTVGSSTERNASAGASTATMDRDHIVSGMSYSSISESVKSPLQGTFYKQAESAKSSPHRASSDFSPPFPDEHDSWLNDDGLGSPLRSPEREAAMVSLEANSRTRTSSSRSHDSDQDLKPTSPDGTRAVEKSIAHARDIRSPTRSPFDDGVSFSFSESPDKSHLGHDSESSGMSFEDFAKGGFSEVTSPALPSNEPDHARRTLSSQVESSRSQATDRSLHPSEKTHDPSTASAGPGLTMFAGFDFSDHASVLPAPAPTPSNRKVEVANANEPTTPTRSGLSAPGVQQKKAERPAAPRADWEKLSKHGPSSSSGSVTSVVPNVVAPQTSLEAGDVNRENGNAMQDDWQTSTHLDKQSRPSATSPKGVLPHGAMVMDDMYFDDGNFDQDISGVDGGSIDEDALDDESFLSRPGFMNRYMHSRDHSGLSASSAGSGGPYPAFAMPNAERASQRYSQMMLEDLPLQAPVDPRYVPQRNPSEDAKRLGLGSRVPPAPVLETDGEAFDRMQRSLQSYHSALAEAANKAAAEGRFVRAPSISNTQSTENAVSLQIHDGPMDDDRSGYATSIGDDRSVYSNGEDGGEIRMPYLSIGKRPDGNGSTASLMTHLTSYSPTKFGFDFGFEQDSITDDINDSAFHDDMFGNDDDLVAAANAEVLASDDGGFYGQEFGFYGRPRSNSDELRAINGGYFGEDGDDGLMRNKSLREPNLTPITERSEFSTRNSFVGLGGPFGPANGGHLGPYSPAIARLGHSPVDGYAPASFDELRRLRGQAFGGGGGPRSSISSARSNSNRSSQHSLQARSPSVDLKPGPYGSGYFGGAQPMQYGYSTSSNGSRNSSVPNNTHPGPGTGFHFNESPQSATSSNGVSSGVDMDATPRKSSVPLTEPTTAKKAAVNGPGHSRLGSCADSVTYVREADPEQNGKQRWVLERRKTSEQGQLELVGREPVQGGWI